MSAIQDNRSYTLTFSGALDDDFLASYCPQGTTLTTTNEIAILDHIRTDQSGIIGLIRHLHNLGCVILQVNTAKDPV
jgi:hypothetical protein